MDPITLLLQQSHNDFFHWVLTLILTLHLGLSSTHAKPPYFVLCYQTHYSSYIIALSEEIYFTACGIDPLHQ